MKRTIFSGALGIASAAALIFTVSATSPAQLGSSAGAPEMAYAAQLAESERIDISRCTINGVPKEIEYSGQLIKPTSDESWREDPFLKDGDTTLKENRDYYVTYTTPWGTIYDPPTEPGSYQIVFHGKNEYKGSIAKSYTIGALDISKGTSNLSVHFDTYAVIGPNSPLVLQGTVSCSSRDLPSKPLVQDKHFTVTYKTTENGTVVKTPTEPGTYYATVEGKAPYCSGSRQLQVLATATNDIRNLSVNIHATYENSRANVSIAVKDRDGKQLVAGTDYEITGYVYQGEDVALSSIPADAYFEVKLRGKGEYMGTTQRDAWLEVPRERPAANDLVNAFATVQKPAYTNGSSVFERVQIYQNKKLITLHEGTDYTVAYYKLTKTGKDTYKATRMSGKPTEPGKYGYLLLPGSNGKYIRATENYPTELDSDYEDVFTLSEPKLNADYSLRGHVREGEIDKSVFELRYGAKKLTYGKDYDVVFCNWKGESVEGDLKGGSSYDAKYRILNDAYAVDVPDDLSTSFSYIDANDLAGADFVVDYSGATQGRCYKYTGEPIVMKGTVTLDGTELVEGKDYELIYMEDSEDEVSYYFGTEAPSATSYGAYKVCARGLGDTYGGTTTDWKPYRITVDGTNPDAVEIVDEDDSNEQTAESADGAKQQAGNSATQAPRTCEVRQPTKTIIKAACPMKVTAAKKNIKLSAKKLKRSARKVTTIRCKKASGKLTFKNVSEQAKAKKYFKVSKKGSITAKKGTKKGKYKVKVRVTCAESAKYEAGTKTVTIKIHVK